MEEQAALDVNALISGCEQTQKSHSLTIRLRLFLDIKETKYYIMESLMINMPMKELKVEEAVLNDDFGFISIHQACEEFRHLVPTRMRKVAKLLQVDLKPHYLQKANLYNMTISDEEGVVYSSIQVDSPQRNETIPFPKDQHIAE